MTRAPACSLADIAVGITAALALAAGAWATTWATTPAADAAHYCFRADPPPCQTTVTP